MTAKHYLPALGLSDPTHDAHDSPEIVRSYVIFRFLYGEHIQYGWAQLLTGNRLLF
jgi:hypothetical protein